MNNITLSREDFVAYMLIHESLPFNSPDDREVWVDHWNFRWLELQRFLREKNTTPIKKRATIIALISVLLLSFLIKKDKKVIDSYSKNSL